MDQNNQKYNWGSVFHDTNANTEIKDKEDEIDSKFLCKKDIFESTAEYVLERDVAVLFEQEFNYGIEMTKKSKTQI